MTKQSLPAVSIVDKATIVRDGVLCTVGCIAGSLVCAVIASETAIVRVAGNGIFGTAGGIAGRICCAAIIKRRIVL